MLKVQEAQLEDHQGPGTAGTAIPQRFLEDSDGVVRLYFCDEILAQGIDAHLFRCSADNCTWWMWQFKALNWTRVQALKLLQGASLQQLFGPRYTVLKVSTRPSYSPLPGVDMLQVVEPIELPPDMKAGAFISLVYQYLGPSKHPAT